MAARSGTSSRHSGRVGSVDSNIVVEPGPRSPDRGACATAREPNAPITKVTAAATAHRPSLRIALLRRVFLEISPSWRSIPPDPDDYCQMVADRQSPGAHVL